MHEELPVLVGYGEARAFKLKANGVHRARFSADLHGGISKKNACGSRQLLIESFSCVPILACHTAPPAHDIGE